MDIYFKDLIQLTDKEPEKCRIELSTDDKDNGKLFIDQWFALSDEEKEEGSMKGLYYNPPGNKYFNNSYLVFSFLRLDTNGNKWLLVSVGEIIKAEYSKCCEVEYDKKWSAYNGRLIVEYDKKGQGRNLKYETFTKKAIINEITAELYGSKFPGYDNINISFDLMRSICTNHGNKSWADLLKAQRGVYLITDKKAGKFYVGSAYGEDGILQRWKCYADTCHGGNKEFMKIYNKEGEQYFRENFRYSILETFNSNQANNQEYAIARESHWKEVLLARDGNVGMNHN